MDGARRVCGLALGVVQVVGGIEVRARAGVRAGVGIVGAGLAAGPVLGAVVAVPVEAVGIGDIGVVPAEGELEVRQAAAAAA